MEFIPHSPRLWEFDIYCSILIKEMKSNTIKAAFGIMLSGGAFMF